MTEINNIKNEISDKINKVFSLNQDKIIKKEETKSNNPQLESNKEEKINKFKLEKSSSDDINLIIDRLDIVKTDLLMTYNFLNGFNIGLGNDKLKKELSRLESSLKELNDLSNSLENN